MQKILNISTRGNDLRSPVDEWNCEDGDLVKKDKEIGSSPTPVIPSYRTVMHAVADGWKLIAPPAFKGQRDVFIDIYDWWLVRD